jgi:poly(A) polymerase Pap1
VYCDSWFDLSSVGDKDLRKMDVQSSMSLNGWRDAQLLGGVLGAANGPLRKKWITLFHIVKHWAKRMSSMPYQSYHITLRLLYDANMNLPIGRGLYSNRLGYLGGYGWSLLAARICQLYQKAPIRELVCRFFDTYANWAWSTQPVALADPVSGRLLPYTLTPRDICGVVTLTPPYRNSARNVTPSTRKIKIE